MSTGNRFKKNFDLKTMGNANCIENKFLAFMQYLLNWVELRDHLTGLRVVRTKILKD